MRDEASAVFAADAVARMTGNCGVAAVTAGPGVTNALTAVKNAQMAQTPLILFGGATATLLKGRGALQDIDQLSLIRSAVKWATDISTVQALGPTLEKAFDVAMGGVPGPVFLEVPVDILYPESIVREWYIKESGVESAKGLGAKALGLYLKGSPLPAVPPASRGPRRARAGGEAARRPRRRRLGGEARRDDPQRGAARARGREPDDGRLSQPGGARRRRARSACPPGSAAARAACWGGSRPCSSATREARPS
ncbi:MAG: thiamine pyrophosphate-binding protein [Sandaracinaceae bacterium]|nr:thiamine pyrophosphate-binding protein [Sandaracinaceae bacterium]